MDRMLSGFGTRAQVLEQDLWHREIKETPGRPGACTEAVDAFVGGLEPALAQRLGR